MARHDDTRCMASRANSLFRTCRPLTALGVRAWTVCQQSGRWYGEVREGGAEDYYTWPNGHVRKALTPGTVPAQLGAPPKVVLKTDHPVGLYLVKTLVELHGGAVTASECRNRAGHLSIDPPPAQWSPQTCDTVPDDLRKRIPESGVPLESA